MNTIMDEKNKKKLAASLLVKKLLYGSYLILTVGISAYILLCIFIFLFE